MPTMVAGCVADTRASLSKAIKTQAELIGFTVCGITSAAHDFGDGLEDWLALGAQGDMGWMAERAHQRRGPRALWPEAQSVIMLGLSYAPESDPMTLAAETDKGRISVYAQGKDYHDVVKKMLKALARWLVETTGCDLKVFVDTAPVMEKPLGQQAGIGWQGKHSNLVSRDHGSWLFLGAIYTILDLEADAPEADHCGSCTACQTACPTDAFIAPYRVDARRCLSYLTIEHKGPIPLEFRRAMGNHIYGCDDCLAACPWNKFADSAAAHKAFAVRDGLAAPALADLLVLDDPAFRAKFSGSPIKRIGRDRMVRNAAIAAGNSAAPALTPLLVSLLEDTSDVVRDAATWALEERAQRC